MANWLDGMIAAVAPGMAVKREQNRLKLSAMSRARSYYDGASRGPRMDHWRTPVTGPNAETRASLPLLRSRSHDLVRNNAWASRGIAVIHRNVVGYGITYSAKHPNSRVEARLKDVLGRHYLTPAIDAEGRHDLFGLQKLAMRSVVEAGEVLIRRRRRRAADNLPLPFQVQVLEAEHLDSSKTITVENGGYIVQGVEFDSIGRRVAYWLFDEHPGDAIRMRGGVSRRIPAEDILHVYRVDRASQVRGVPWLAPVVVSLRDFQDYEDAQLVRQKIAACFAVFEVTQQSPEEFDPANSPRQEPVQPGMWVQATPGYDLKFPNPPSVDAFADYSRVTAHKIAAGLDVPYEALTGDLSQVNFSSGRMGWLEFQRALEEWRWTMLIPQLCDPLLAWGIGAADDFGIVAGARMAKVTWTPPKREMIDPVKETKAAVDAIRGGLATHSGTLRELGIDPDEHFDEYADDLERLDKRKIKLDSDARNDMAPAALAPAEEPPQQEPTNG
jgi:lambda family phage portal protein